MVESQAFAQFLQDRIGTSAAEYDVMVFDESIKQKLNRSRLRFSKETTPFLNETTYQISTKYFTLEANMTNLPKGKGITIDPYKWKDECEIEPRQVRQLMTEKDLSLMKSHTLELMSRSQTTAQKEKSEFSKWMKRIKVTKNGILTDEQRQ